MSTERRKWGMRDWLYILVAVGGLAWVGKVFVLANNVTENMEAIKKMQPVVDGDHTEIAVIHAQLTQIQEGIGDIKRQLRFREYRRDDR